jgi:c-di-GMP-binding flagellar brake protein YcgR
MEEHRSVARWQVYTEARVKFNDEEEAVDCRVEDINFKGLKMLLKERLVEDTNLKFALTLSEDFTLEAQAWVVWRKDMGIFNVYGLHFTRIKDSDKERIYRFVYKSVSQDLKQKWWQGLEEEKGGETMEDRRIFGRFPAKLLMRFFNPADNQESSAETSDVSAKGIGLVLNEELRPHTHLEMWLRVPDKGEPLYTRGEVVWSKEAEAGQFKTGIELEKADLMGMSRVLRSI